MPRIIVIEISDWISDEEAQEFVTEINEVFSPHKDAYLKEV